MAEEFDSHLRAAFAAYRTEAMTDLPPQDLAGVRALASHRRRVHTVVATAAAVVILAIPAVGYATGGNRNHPHPLPPGPQVTAPVDPAPSGSSSAQPSPSGSRTPAPDGRISKSELTNAGVDLPAWDRAGAQCPTRNVKFQPTIAEQYTAVIDQLTYLDLDGDSATETVALLDCRIGQGPTQQVVAFDRTSSGAIVTMGQVVSVDSDAGAVQVMFALRAGADGRIGVQVGDLMPCCGPTELNVEHQWRWYSWTGSRFRQTGGPTAFTPAPTEYGSTAVTVTPVVLGAATGGVRHATVTVTVRNDGPGTAPGVRLAVGLVTRDGSALPKGTAVSAAVKGCAVESGQLVCHYPALAAGTAREYQFTVAWPASADAVLTSPGVDLRVTGAPEQPGIRVFGDGVTETQQVTMTPQPATTQQASAG